MTSESRGGRQPVAPSFGRFISSMMTIRLALLLVLALFANTCAINTVQVLAKKGSGGGGQVGVCTAEVCDSSGDCEERECQALPPDSAGSGQGGSSGYIISCPG